VGQGGQITPNGSATDASGVLTAQLTASSPGDIRVVAGIGNLTLTTTVTFTEP
jgi:hypothetical protein